MDYAARLHPERFIIFLFHGVIEKQTRAVRNYTRKHLTKDHFAAALRSLDQAGDAVSMDDILAAYRGGGSLPPRSFAITFDDGFENNVSVAAPILADMNIPATFYVTTDFVEQNRMSWVDRIEWAVEDHGGASITVPWGTLDFDASPQSKRAALDIVRARVKSDKAIEPDVFATDVQAKLGHREPVFSSTDPLDRKMTWDQVRRLHTTPGFRVGGHTQTHAILSFLDAAPLDAETAGALDILKRRAGISTHHFSYPEGLTHCYSDAVIAKLQSCGISICPTAEDGDNDRNTSPFLLKRIMAL